MIRYIGTKIIHAEPFTRIDEHGKAIPGYSVKYEDGYTSWSPKDTFEAAYRPATGMTFGLALEALKKGLCVSRVGWKEAGQVHTHWVTLEADKSFKCQTEGASWTGWFPTNLDMLADDWITV
jgi:hypothetical protein